MSNVFLIGAGYIGIPVALALRQAGHNVTGLVRSTSKSAELIKHEIRVVEGFSGFVYGHSSGGLGHMAFGAVLKSGKLTIVGNPQNRFAYSHVADLADGYRRVVEAPVSVIDREIFNIVDFSHPTNEEMLVAAAKVAGFTGKPEYRAAESDFEKFADASCACSPLKTIRLLNWTPRHVGFVEEIELYFKAYKAANGIP